MTTTKSSMLVQMTTPIHEGFEGMVGTYWVRQQNGVFRHTSEMQTELKVTLRKDEKWEDYFTPATAPEPVDSALYVVKLTAQELSATIEAFIVAEWSPEGRPPLKAPIMLDGGPHGKHSVTTQVGENARRKFGAAERSKTVPRRRAEMETT